MCYEIYILINNEVMFQKKAILSIIHFIQTGVDIFFWLRERLHSISILTEFAFVRQLGDFFCILLLSFTHFF